MTTRQYARLVSDWIAVVGLDPRLFGTHSLRRTKATLIYRRTGNLRAVQLLLGHTKIESTVRRVRRELITVLPSIRTRAARACLLPVQWRVASSVSRSANDQTLK